MAKFFNEQDSLSDSSDGDDPLAFARPQRYPWQQRDDVREANTRSEWSGSRVPAALNAWRDNLEPLKSELKKTRINVDDAVKTAHGRFTAIEELRETLAAKNEELEVLGYELAGQRRQVAVLSEELSLEKDRRRMKLEEDRKRLVAAKRECQEDAERLGTKVGKEKQEVQADNAKHKKSWVQRQTTRERKIRAVVLAFDDISSWTLRLFGSEPEIAVMRWMESLQEILRTLLKECTVVTDPNASTSPSSPEMTLAAKRLQEATLDMVDDWVAIAARARAGTATRDRAPELDVALREERATAERLQATLEQEHLKGQALEAELVAERQQRKYVEEERTTFAPIAAKELQAFDEQNTLLKRELEAAQQSATATKETVRARRKAYEEAVKRLER